MSIPYHKKLASELGCKPCPFCGGVPQAWLVGTNKEAICCSKCGAHTKASHAGHYITLEKARDYWNKRVYE